VTNFRMHPDFIKFPLAFFHKRLFALI